MSWRDRARPIIAEVLERTKGEPEKVIRRDLRKAWSWGERKNRPYAIWLDEIKRQRGMKPPLGTRKKPGQAAAPKLDDPDQIGLFSPPAYDPTLHEALAAAGFKAVDCPPAIHGQRVIVNADGDGVFVGRAGDVWDWLKSTTNNAEAHGPGASDNVQ